MLLLCDVIYALDNHSNIIYIVRVVDKQFLVLNSKGLLTEFIIQKTLEHHEPHKLGIPRGDLIGFSQKKYNACLLSLTNIPIKEQAKMVKVSYGFLRFWRSENRFLESAHELSDEFAGLFFANIERNDTKDVSSSPIKFHNMFRKLASEIENKKENVIAKKENQFADKELYGRLALNSIFEKLIQKLKYSEKIDLRVFEESILSLDLPPTRSKEKIYSEMRNVLIERCQKNLTQIELKPGNRKEALEILDFLKSFLDKLEKNSGKRK